MIDLLSKAYESAKQELSSNIADHKDSAALVKNIGQYIGTFALRSFQGGFAVAVVLGGMAVTGAVAGHIAITEIGAWSFWLWSICIACGALMLAASFVATRTRRVWHLGICIAVAGASAYYAIAFSGGIVWFLAYSFTHFL